MIVRTISLPASGNVLPPSGCLGYHHGLSGTELYFAWCNMLARCLNPNHPRYKYYGALGVTVCQQWQTSFAQFRVDAYAAGYKPDIKLQIDRIDPRGNYEPTNIRWVTKEEQARNLRNTCWLTAFDERKTASEWALDERCSVTRNTIIMRVRAGWPHDVAITAPKGFQWRKSMCDTENSSQ